MSEDPAETRPPRVDPSELDTVASPATAAPPAGRDHRPYAATAAIVEEMEERLRRALDQETCGAIRAEVREATRDDLLRELRDELGDIDAAHG